jgi:hypothetical protein
MFALTCRSHVQKLEGTFDLIQGWKVIGDKTLMFSNQPLTTMLLYET